VVPFVGFAVLTCFGKNFVAFCIFWYISGTPDVSDDQNRLPGLTHFKSPDQERLI
jgi:hypothetical protein